MNLDFCPNKKSKEFKELVSALGGEDKAYLVWMRNKGNHLDKAPNGADSELFKSLLDYYKGDRKLALIAKAKTYNNEFLDWFGDWLHLEPKEIITSVKETVNRDQNWVDGSEVVKSGDKYYYQNEIGARKEITELEFNDFNNGKDITLSEKTYVRNDYDHSKVIDDNGEPLVMYHVTTSKGIEVFDRAKSRHGGFWFSHSPNYYVKNAIELPEVDVVPAFLNIREPNEIGHNTFLNAVDGDVLQETLDDIKFDGWITRYIHLPEYYEDPYSESEPVFAMATDSNQIKSAVKNNGEFSIKDDNIYNNLVYNDAYPIIMSEIKRQGITRTGLRGGIYLTSGNTHAKRALVDRIARSYGATVNFWPNGRFYVFTNVHNATLRKESDVIEEGTDQNQEFIDAIISHLQRKFVGMRVAFLEENEIPAGIKKNARCFVKGNTVYLIRGRITADTTIEEFFHPLLLAVYAQNTPLFLDLVAQAKEEFPMLWAQIRDTYNNKLGFNDFNRDCEIVTQALSRYARVGFKSNVHKKGIAELAWGVLKIIADFVADAFSGLIYGDGYINIRRLPKMKLREFSTLVIANDTKFQVYVTDKVLYSISASSKSEQEIAKNITQRFNVLYRAYERMPNKSPKRQLILNKIFELYNELQLHQDISAVRIALDFGLLNIGVLDNTTGTPSNMSSVLGYLYNESLKTDPYSGVTPKNLVDMYQNSIGFYENLLNNYIPNNLNSKLTPQDRAKVTLLRENVNLAKSMWTQAMVVVGDRIVDEQIDNEVDLEDADKENMKTVAKDWLHKNTMYGDISSFQSYVFNNGYSSNPIIKLAFHLIQHAETKTLEEIHPIAERVAKAFRRADKLYKSIGPNWLTILMEFDENGIPTGNFVRDVNYGQYEKDLENFIKELNEEFERDYGHTYVDDGNGVMINSLTNELAEDEDWSNGEPTYVKYLKRIEQFKCERANRRYTLDYYMERLSQPYKGSLDPNDVDINKFGHGLSPKALSRYNHIQSNINYYLDKCTDANTGLSYPERLNDQDKASLDAWRASLDDLSNPFNGDMTPKSDDERQIAFEIRAWLKWIGEKMTTEVDLDAYTDELTRLTTEASLTGDYKPVWDFVKYNSRIGINPDFIEQTIGGFVKSHPTDQLAIHALYLKLALQSMVKTQQGYTRDLGKMENRPEFWLNCKRMDQLIEDGRSSADPDFAKALDENFSFDLIIYRDTYGKAVDANGNTVEPADEHLHNDLLTYQQYLINKYTNLALSNPNRTILGLNDANGNPIVFSGTPDQVKDVISKLFSYRKQTVHSDGTITVEYVPLTIFSMMTPKEDSFFNTRTGRQERTLLQVPTGRFAEKLDKSGRYMNQYYNHSDMNAEQPRIDYIDSKGNHRYDNRKAWYKVANNMDVKYLYDTLIDVMQQSLDNYSTLNRRFNYRLPLINADSMLLMSRLLRNGFKNTAQALFDSVTTVEENDESMRTADDYMTNPDGSIATDVPLKFVRKLKDPSRLTTDIAGSVILFANMALNYKNKCEIDAQLKTLRCNLDPNNRKDIELSQDEFSPSDDDNSLSQFDSMLNKHMYNNQWSTKPQEGPNSKTVVAWNKAMRKVHRLETTQMLALNLFSMLVGFGDSSFRILKESIMGKYMTVQDTVTALFDCIIHTPQIIANIGNPVANTKIGRAMQVNGISKGVHQIYEHMNYGRVRKIFNNLLMGGFSMLDWMANSLLLRSYYNNVRFYDGGVVDTGFYSLYELELAFVKAGHKKKEAILAHTMCTTTLWGAYDNNMEIKPQYEQYVTQKIKTRVRTKTLQRSALYNGMNPDNDTPRYKLSIVGNFIGAMRGWLTQAIQHLLAGGTDNTVRNIQWVRSPEVKGIKTKFTRRAKADKLTDEQRYRRMSWNYETGTPNDQIYVGIARSFNTLGKKLWRYATLQRGAKAADAKFSYVERYAWRDAIIYMGVLGLCMIAWPMLNELAAAVPPPEDREQAGPTSISDIPRFFNEQYIEDQYWKMLASDIGFRIIESQITSIDPTSAMDVVNSITTLNSGVNEHIGLIKAAGDVTGLSGHSTDEVVKHGGYKYYTRGERNLYKALGPLDNLQTTFTYYGIKTNQSYYTNTYGGVYRWFGYDFKHEQEKKKTGPTFAGPKGGNGPSFSGPKFSGPK